MAGMIFQVSLYDAATKTTKTLSCAKLDGTDWNNKTLSDVRQALAANGKALDA
jgi:hypothetical protein